MANVVITGGTGMIGTLLCKMLLERNNDVFVLTTQKTVRYKSPNVNYVFWNPEELIIDPAFTIEDCKIINLAGAGVAEKRWNTERKNVITGSRILSLHTLYNAIKSRQINATHLVSASAIGYYAESDERLSELDPPDNSFLSQTCLLWEHEAHKFNDLQIKTSIARIGIVLGRKGGALKEFLNTMKYGVAAIPGDGNQIMSWIHIEDMCRMLIYLADNGLAGIFNAVADNPVTANDLFAAILHIKKGFRVKIHIPSFILKFVLGEMSSEIMKSAEVSNEKIHETGFDFKYKTIDAALTDLLIS